MLLLCALFQFKDKEFNEPEFLNSADVRSDVGRFMRDKGPDNMPGHKAETCVYSLCSLSFSSYVTLTVP